MSTIGFSLTLVALLIWLGLLLFRGWFWRSDQRLETASTAAPLAQFPSVCAVIPARNEADLLPVTLRSLLTQDYAGKLTMILVDDHSTDGTAEVAKATAASLNRADSLQVISAAALPAGWSGKLWAMEQGIQAAQKLSPDYFLLTDADIEHDPANLTRLMQQAIQQNLDLASVMVRLRCESFWEKLLIPAFVFFFEKLYPFRWVNNPQNSTAAAAGGCILIRHEALDRIGGIAAIRHALIDDCALAEAVKRPNSKFKIQNSKLAIPNFPIWLGLSDRTRSLRPYPSLSTIWEMVARTAFTQLNYSPLLLLGAVFGMSLTYLAPPVGLVLGLVLGNRAIALTGLAGYLLMTWAYLPTVQFYRCPRFAACLPAIALLYTVMTIDSALRHWQGRGGAWKGRVYPKSDPA
jgi:hopene-associated glycosyltransferase HpnB